MGRELDMPPPFQLEASTELTAQTAPKDFRSGPGLEWSPASQVALILGLEKTGTAQLSP